MLSAYNVFKVCATFRATVGEKRLPRVLGLIDTAGTGGAETVYAALERGLRGLGWECVVTVPAQGWLSDELRRFGATPVILPTNGSFDARWLLGILSLVREQRIDIIHSHLQGAAVYGAMAGRLAGIPTVSTLHGLPDLEFSPYSGSVKASIIKSRNNTCVFVSEWLRGRARGIGFEPHDSRVVWNGVDLDSLMGSASSRRRANQHPIRVGAIGNVLAAKDYATLLRAAAWLHDEHPGRFQFNVYGETSRDPALFSLLLDLRSKLRLSAREFSFRGFEPDVGSVLQGLDMLAVSSSSESFSLAVVEALAAGVPIVSTRCGGPEEILTHRVTGVFVSPEEPVEMARAILELSEQPLLAEEIAAAGVDHAVARYSLNAMVASYASIFLDRLSQARDPLPRM